MRALRTLATLWLAIPAIHSATAQDPVRVWRAEPLPGPTVRFAVSPTGKRVATLGEDLRVILHEAMSRAVLRKSAPIADSNTRLFFSPDGEILVAVHSAWRRPGLHAWRAKDGAPIPDWKQHTIGVTGYKVPDPKPENAYGHRLFRHEGGHVVFDPGYHQRAFVAADGKLPASPGDSDQSWHLTPDGERLVVVQGDAWRFRRGMANAHQKLSTYVVEIANGKVLHTETWNQDHPRGSKMPDFLPATDGRHVAVVLGSRVALFTLENHEEVRRFGENVTCVMPHRGGWITGHGDGSVRGWKKGEATIVLPWSEKARNVGKSVSSLIARGDRIGAISRAGAMVWNGEKAVGHHSLGRQIELHADAFAFRGQNRFVVYVDDTPVRSPTVNYDSRHSSYQMLGAGRAGYLDGLDFRLHYTTEKKLPVRFDGHAGKVDRLEWGATGLLARARGLTGFPAAWMLAESGEVKIAHDRGPVHVAKRLIDLTRHIPGILAASGKAVGVWPHVTVVSSDGRFSAIRTKGKLRVRALATGRTVREVDVSRDELAVALSPDGSLLAYAYASRHRTVRVLSVKNGEEQFEYSAPLGSNRISFSPDGAYLIVSGSLDMRGMMEILDLRGNVLHRMKEDTIATLFVGKRLVKSAHDGDLSVFDLAKRKEVATFQLPRVRAQDYSLLLPIPAQDGVIAHTWGGRRAHRVHLTRGVVEGITYRTTNRSRHPLDILPDGSCVVAAEIGLQLFGPTDHKPKWEAPNVVADAVYVAPDGKHFAVIEHAAVNVYKLR